MNTLYDKRTKDFSRPITYGGMKCTITVRLRFDDECKNKHNAFAITGSIVSDDKRLRDPYLAGGCIHDEIAKYFPKLKPLIKWHEVHDGEWGAVPVENTLFFLGYAFGPGNIFHRADRDEMSIEAARRAAIWPDMPESFLCGRDERMLQVTRNKASKPVRAALEARLPALMAEFHAAMAAIEWDTVVPRT